VPSDTDLPRRDEETLDPADCRRDDFDVLADAVERIGREVAA
jgi:hypothetical protein